MSSRRSLKLPITLGVVMFVLLTGLAVGWILLTVRGALGDSPNFGLYITLLSAGSVILVFMIVGTAIYLGVSVKAINLARRQSNFMDSVTHELKSPIASLKLYLQTLTRHSVGPEQTADFYRFMLEDVERLDQLINHLLDAARIENEPAEEAEQVDLAELLSQCGESVRQSQRAAEGTVTYALEPCSTMARRVDLEMIFRNLIDNAIKYASDQPQVQVELRVIGEEAHVAVSDNGPGIPRKMRRRIFGRFVRLGEELEREKTGTGLGLYIVRTLVRRLGGAVYVHDRDPAPGTVFVVTLPESRSPKRPPPTPETEDPPAESSPSPRPTPASSA